MAKITRLSGNYEAFAAGALAGERTVFGEETVSDDLTAQHTTAYEQGWRGAVAPSGVPTVQDFNALGFSLDKAIAYLHQVGVPEWDAAQEYYDGSVCTYSDPISGTSYLWIAITSSMGQAPQEGGGYWTILGSALLGDNVALSVAASGGDFASISDALVWCHTYLRPWHSGAALARVTITAESGFVMDEPIVVDGVDLGWITIACDDLEIDASGLNTPVLGDGFFRSFAAFAAVNGGVAPSLEIVSATITGTGTWDSEIDYVASIGPGSRINVGTVDVTGLKRHAVCVQAGGYCFADAVDASGHSGSVIYCSGLGSGVLVPGAIRGLSNLGDGQFGVYSGPGAVVECRDLIAVLMAGTASSAAGVWADGGKIIAAEMELLAGGSTASGALSSNGGIIDCRGLLNVSQNTTNGVYCLTGGLVRADSISATLCAWGVRAVRGNVIAAEVTCTGCSAGIHASSGGEVRCSQISASTCTTFGLETDDGGRIICTGTAVLTSAGTSCIISRDGGLVAIGGNVTASNSTSHNVHALGGDIRFATIATVTATNTNGVEGLRADGGIISGGTINALTALPTFQHVCVYNGGRIMRVAGNGTSPGASTGINISADGHVNR